VYENFNFRATFHRNPSHESSAKFLKQWDTRKVPVMKFYKLGVSGSVRKVIIIRLFLLFMSFIELKPASLGVMVRRRWTTALTFNERVVFSL
jgi:hypothetical protein